MALVMMFSVCPISPVKISGTSYENIHINTGNYAYDIVEVARTQICYKENGRTVA
ncbi:MAG: hypothetical protein K2G36_01850 [Ruminococcus sp.]|nr:hypothetical protein [Ruminococcus sp.]